MDLFESLLTSLSSPMVLAFLLGIIATRLKSDLKFPDGFYQALTVYLLFAIGFKGGVKLSQTSLEAFLRPGLGAIFLCLCIPVWSYFVLRKMGGLDRVNAAAISAHFGSVSAVTFSEGTAFLELLGEPYEGFMPSLLAIMEIPAILMALFLARVLAPKSDNPEKTDWGKVLHELFTGKGTLLLIGGLVIGMLSGKKGMEQVGAFFDSPFRGVLTLFLLEVGLVTGRRLGDLKNAGFFLIGFGVLMPIIHGCLGVYLGQICGLSQGGATLFGLLAASASYIAAPAAVRIALPEANPAYYLTASLAIAFPFNVTIGLPMYYTLARWIYGG
jgi:hypothetical protein